MSEVSHKYHKRIWQKVPDTFLYYLYSKYIVYASNK